MKQGSIVVHAIWDEDARVWVASSSDIDGLALEADTIEALEPRIRSAITELLILNRVTSNLSEIPVHIRAEHSMLVSNPGF